LVKLDLLTNDYGVLQVPGRRGWLKLIEPEEGETGPEQTEHVFIGEPQTVKDLRAFQVIFV
jgi:hypothetical protein